MKLTLLGEDSLEFPPSATAANEPNGLLAIGGDLSVPRLLSAYRRGIFPWFDETQPILWWTPDPRTIIYPNQVHCSRSMAKFLRLSQWQLRMDTRFADVIEACRGTRKRSSGTWITSKMKSAYLDLHFTGYAHSMEVWDGDELIGGLYGVALGRAFFGESMFSSRTNASKMALIVLARFLSRHGFIVFDCQVASEHLFSLGATEVPRSVFERMLAEATETSSIAAMQATWHKAANKVISSDGYISN